MKKIITLFLLFLTSFQLFASNEVKLVNENQNSLTISVDFNEYSIVPFEEISGVMHSKIIAQNTYPSLSLGNPNLPRLTCAIELPATGSSSYTIISSSFKEYENIFIAPSKGNLKRNVNPSLVPFTKSNTYNSDVFYPENMISLNNPFIFRSVRGQSIEIIPFQYNPVTNVLRVYTNIELKVQFNEKKSGINEINSSNVLNRHINNINSRRFINYKSEKYTPVEEDGSMLVICKDDLMDDMEGFLNWKFSKGMTTELVPISSIGNNQSSIYNYVKNYYTSNPDLVYLLIVGDHADVKSYNAGSTGQEIKWSDSKYGLLAGNNDWYPDVFVGRFSASNSTDLQTILSRNMEYEISPVSGDWYQKALGIGSDEGQGYGDNGEADWQHLRNIRTDLMNYGFTEVFEFYDGSHGGQDANGSPNSNMIKNAVNAGVTLFNYTGHGAQNSCATGNFSSTHINQCNNQGKYPFVISVACNNGTFTNGTCLSEQFMLAEQSGSPTGAISVCGSSILMSWAPPMASQDEVVDILIESYAQNKKFTLGGLFYNGQMDMMDAYNNSGREVVETWIFFGDPSVKIRTLNPTDLIASHATELDLGSSSLTISNCNAEGALICLTQGNNQLGTGLVDANGEVTISFPALDSIVDLTVVGTNYNFRPYQGNVKVIEPGVDVEPTFTVFPNPISTNEALTVSFNLNEDADVIFSILNGIGQLVQQVELSGLNAGTHQEIISISGYRTGIYKIAATINGDKVVSKFMVK
uniref:Peptidase, C25 family (Arginine-specific cysteine proteinase) n=1 Tax=uncultured Flavobacteriia bacterium TaxID=212695 RepID=H6RER1_9BACT|nr:arginine-specific cysteine proteinase [uncultured bacterium]CCF99522.1 peptidase, C25 family (arginine-specific cysteine proteinase) [uncultured Flavobacteriia bacterium]